MFILKFLLYFTLSFFILCIPAGDGLHLFDRLFNLVSPYADRAVNATKQKVETTKRYSKKLYSNSEPVEKDSIKLKLSGTKKIQQEHKEPDDTYTAEERARLRKVLSGD